MSDIPTKAETRGRKPINADGSKRCGRYVKCPNCCESFYYDHRDKRMKATPRRRANKKKQESEQDLIDRLISEPWEKNIKINIVDPSKEQEENFI